jgi:hypothetical protein
MTKSSLSLLPAPPPPPEEEPRLATNAATDSRRRVFGCVAGSTSRAEQVGHLRSFGAVPAEVASTSASLAHRRWKRSLQTNLITVAGSCWSVRLQRPHFGGYV